MTTRKLLAAGASALLLGGIGIGMASASDRNDARAAAADAAKASKALAHHQVPAAIAAAEAAVARAAQTADYRVLLGQSYLAAGRFVSARDAFADAVTLAPTNGKAALNLALMEIATGDWAGARRTLDEHSAGIAPADRGLATALAGDPAGAVAMLTQVARSSDATPKIRQNLALSLALAGEWQAARTVAAVDLSPADVDARMEQWAAFARPTGASDQVASLLGIRPAADGGEPARFALTTGPATVTAATAATASVTPMPTPAIAPAAITAPAAPIAPTSVAQPGFASRVVFAERREVVQTLPAAAMEPRGTVIAAGRGPAKVSLSEQSAAAPASLAKGGFFVQLGAYRSAAVAHDAWGRATHRFPDFAARGASGMTVSVKGASYYRLSVGGFARGDADALCRRYRQSGGVCFVRAGAGDQVASWAKKSVQVAAR